MTILEKTVNRDQIIDVFESRMSKMSQVEMPVKHIFTPGLYVREIQAKAGTILTSKIHKYEHPFVLSKGKLRIYDSEIIELEAPFTGVTPAGTRRLIKILEDVIWTTFHVTDKTTVEEVEKDIILARGNPLIWKKKRNKLSKKGEC
mgnify:CR=1 FL=1|jgi:hypothetical protein